MFLHKIIGQRYLKMVIDSWPDVGKLWPQTTLLDLWYFKFIRDAIGNIYNLLMVLFRASEYCYQPFLQWEIMFFFTDNILQEP